MFSTQTVIPYAAVHELLFIPLHKSQLISKVNIFKDTFTWPHYMNSNFIIDIYNRELFHYDFDFLRFSIIIADDDDSRMTW